MEAFLLFSNLRRDSEHSLRHKECSSTNYELFRRRFEKVVTIKLLKGKTLLEHKTRRFLLNFPFRKKLILISILDLGEINKYIIYEKQLKDEVSKYLIVKR
jgi:hypothetical protein